MIPGKFQLNDTEIDRLIEEKASSLDLADKAYVDTKAGSGGSDCFFPIWAEENSSLGANTYEWAFGNGANTAADEGIMMYVPPGYTCHCVAMGVTLGGSVTASATVELVLNAVPLGSACNVVVDGVGQGLDDISVPQAIVSGDRITFRTTTAVGTGTACQVVAWFKLTKV